MAETKVIALAGKGGVGKTTLSAAFVRILMEARPDSRILAIDADPAVGLATALGVQVASTVDDIRNSVIEIAKGGAPHKAVELLGEARYRMLDTLVEEAGFSFLAIGRPETAGCYCQVNAYLKEVIRMISSSFDYVIIDGVPILCCIGNDGVHAVNEVRGGSIFALPEDALVLCGARQALKSLAVL